MEAARHYTVHEAKTHFSRVLEQVAAGEEVVMTLVPRDNWIPHYGVRVMLVRPVGARTIQASVLLRPAT
ncbi:type II toxin-antitoxin system Phd/YefM family antitoxin [Streptomyces sp. NPDC056937]|uniref:type II toxin-antitoxin system Phd/YefM family antitoxin n=1 Tax=Streptomyces sp. NPDC056937 TaxID=3345969 RepID=UPI0036254740